MQVGLGELIVIGAIRMLQRSLQDYIVMVRAAITVGILAPTRLTDRGSTSTLRLRQIAVQVVR